MPWTRRHAMGLGLSALALAGLLQAPAAWAQSKTAPVHIAVASVLGDNFAVVTRQVNTGSLLDANLRDNFKLSDGVFDTPALLAMEGAIKQAAPAAQYSLMKLSQSEALSGAAALLDGASFAAPAGLKAVFEQIHATHFLMLSAFRAPAVVIDAQGVGVGNGWLEGVGYYIDRHAKVRRHEEGGERIGYIAPFTYFKLSLFDLASGKQLASKVVNRAPMRADFDKGLADPWEMLTMKEKLDMLTAQLKTEIEKAVPEVLPQR
ncbi:hypothetical protein RQP53_21450 [Paucibacter sp. APW11]|uniref:Uncharacterized protein n=1 Tax=Roseateles aquae TaxID=3077235 RepID=A0ABU3PHL9_9BURK|nr:hypothetical protein [Paucibacter sp. APW11]MDT9001857.1 hypothetical protein [Paucibacter sp. APW11]